MRLLRTGQPARHRVGLIALAVLLVALPGTVVSAGGAVAGAPSHALPHTARADPGHALPHVDGVVAELPPHRPLPADRLARPASGVSPYNYYTDEPAPVGIADFGLDASGNGYTYHTSEFLGVTYLRNFSVYNPDDGAPYVVSIQLNVVLQFKEGGALYQYWIQDVSFLDTSQNAPTFLNNIWNLSSANLSMGNDSVTGNGSVYGDEFYEDSASGTGNGVALPAVSELDLLVVASVVDDTPAVAFEYRDDYGWQTYDNVVFPFAVGATGTEFLVDGTQYAPDGLYDDAELTLGGPGGGTNTTADYANLSMALETWNGHNFAAVRNAYNFGSDTGESISGLRMHHSGSSTNATLSDDLSIGSSSLGLLYSSAYSSVLNVSTDVPASDLVIADGPGIPYVGGSANVTIAPGTFPVWLYNATGAIASGEVTVPSGGYATVDLSEESVYPVTFAETGLFGGIVWNVTLGAAEVASHRVDHRFFMANGTYAYAVPRLPGFLLNNSTGTVVVAGAPTTLNLSFVAVVYGVQIYEAGLPAGTDWSFSVFNRSYASNGISVSFALPNGSWSYSIGEIPGWTAYPDGAGQLEVRATELTETISFSRFRLPILVNETGLPLRSWWGVRVGDDWYNASSPTVRDTEPNGSYSYRIRPPPGWMATPEAGTVNVQGRATGLNVSFTPYAYPVDFVESGLPAGTLWGVSVDGTLENATGAELDFDLANGTYHLAVAPPAGYYLTGGLPAGDNLTVDGVALTENLTFAVIPPEYGEIVGSLSPSAATLTVDGVPTATSAGRFTLRLLVGEHTLTAALHGYWPYSETVNVTANSQLDLAPIVLQPVSPPATGSGHNLTLAPASGLSGTSLVLAGLGIVGAGATVIGALLLRYRRGRL